MTTSPEALREAVERLQRYAHARTDAKHSTDILVVLSALQESRKALGPFADACDSADEGTVDNQAHCWESAMAMSVTYGDFRRAAEVYRALSPGGADE